MQVCSDRALGFNFNAISCESCKAFFRRNATSSKKFSCPFSNVCEITVITRRFCQRCRLEKCFKVGMKKEYIMSEQDKELKRIKIAQNRTKRKLKTSGVETGVSREDQEVHSKKCVKEMSSPEPSPAPSHESNSSEVSFEKVSSAMSAEEIVTEILQVPDQAGAVIKRLMRDQSDALLVMTKIINDPSQALILVSHLIKRPEDGLMIISKILDSPFHTLSLFSQLMRSQTDALQVIFKLISKPEQVLQFINEIAQNPSEVLKILRQFMSVNIGETLAEINNLMTKVSDETECDHHHPNEMIKSMLEVSSVDSSTSNASSPSAVPNDVHSTDYNNNCGYDTMKLLNEISQDVNCEQTNCQGSSIDSIINMAIQLEYSTPSTVNQLRTSSRHLNDVEIFKIQELLGRLFGSTLIQSLKVMFQTLIKHF